MDIVEAVYLCLRPQTQQGQRYECWDPFFHQLPFLFVLARETLMRRSSKNDQQRPLSHASLLAMKFFRPQPPGCERVEDRQEDVRTPGL
jgi:hypothetical protein